MNHKKLQATVRLVTDLLADRQYEALEQLTNGRRLSAIELASAVEGYGQSLTRLPEDALRQVEASEREGGGSWWSDVDLFTVEGGHSDLTLQLTLRESQKRASEIYEVEIEDLHVL